MPSTLELLRTQLSDTTDIESDLALFGLQTEVAETSLASLEELAQKMLASQDEVADFETPLMEIGDHPEGNPALFDQALRTFTGLCRKQQEAGVIATRDGTVPPTTTCAQLRAKEPVTRLDLPAPHDRPEIFQDALEVTLISLSMQLVAPLLVKQLLAADPDWKTNGFDLQKLEQILINTRTNDPATLLAALQTHGIPLTDAQTYLFTMLQDPQDPLSQDFATREFPQVGKAVKKSLFSLAQNYNAKLQQIQPGQAPSLSPQGRTNQPPSPRTQGGSTDNRFAGEQAPNAAPITSPYLVSSADTSYEYSDVPGLLGGLGLFLTRAYLRRKQKEPATPTAPSTDEETGETPPTTTPAAENRKPRWKKVLKGGLVLGLLGGLAYGGYKAFGGADETAAPSAPTTQPDANPDAPDENVPAEAEPQEAEVPGNAAEVTETETINVSSQDLTSLATGILQSAPGVSTKKFDITPQNDTLQIATTLEYDTKVPVIGKVEVKIQGSLQNDGTTLKFTNPVIDAGLATKVVEPLAKPILTQLVPQLRRELEAKHKIKISKMNIQGGVLVLSHQVTKKVTAPNAHPNGVPEASQQISLNATQQQALYEANKSKIAALDARKSDLQGAKKLKDALGDTPHTKRLQDALDKIKTTATLTTKDGKNITRKQNDPILLVDSQHKPLQMYLIENDAIKGIIPVSTGAAGFGNTSGSGKTSTGTMLIDAVTGTSTDPTKPDILGPKKETYGQSTSAYEPGDYNQGQITMRKITLQGLESANHNVDSRYIYLHGTNCPQELGYATSHGCIRLGNADILQLGDYVTQAKTGGKQVFVHVIE